MISSFVRALVSRGPRIEAGATAAQRASTFWSRCSLGLDTQVSARERGIPLLDGVFPARTENSNRRHRLRPPDLGLATG